MPSYSRIVFLVLIGFFCLATLARAQNNCVACHSTLEDAELARPALAMSDDVHAAAGIDCVGCHGGDATLEISGEDYEAAKASETGYVGAPGVQDVPAFCGKCHSDADYMQEHNPDLAVDQMTLYWTSAHGKMLEETATEDVAQCASCHGSHGMRAVRDPRSPVHPTNVADTCGTCHADEEHMAPYDLEPVQIAEYRDSVHGTALEQGDLSAPTCSTCHGNHGPPPGVESVSLVCGTCHAIQQQFLAASPHGQAFIDFGEPGCVTCHGNHAVQPADDRLLGVEEGQVCSECHFEDEESYTIAQTLRRDIEDLKAAIAQSTATVHAAAVAGMEVSEAEVTLIDANQALIQARNAVHAVSLETLAEHTNAGRALADEALGMGQEALAELSYRQRGLGVSVFFIVLVVIGLHLKIRQIEAPQTRNE